MKKLLGAACGIIISMLAVSEASAERITGSSVNCRAAPRANASVVGTLKAGETVFVQSRMSGWVLVGVRGLSCWVSGRYVVDDTGETWGNSPSTSSVNSGSDRSASRAAPSSGIRQSYANSAPAVGARSAPAAGTRKRAASPRRSASRSSSTGRRRSSGYSAIGGSCPCSGRNICIGPRGGRYCITSGGNKRYGL